MTEQEKQEAYKHKLEFIQAMAQLDSKEKDINSSQVYIKSYLWSILIPPIGIYYFVKYIFFANRTRDNVKAGFMSLILTIISLLLSIWLFDLFFKQATSLMPSQGSDILKELITPANQKSLNDLYR